MNDALLDAKPCATLRTTLGEADAARIAEALHTDQSGADGLALARLRNELFQLEVRERHSQMQAAMLQELEGAETALGGWVVCRWHDAKQTLTAVTGYGVDCTDLKIVDVEVSGSTHGDGTTRGLNLDSCCRRHTPARLTRCLRSSTPQPMTRSAAVAIYSCHQQQQHGSFRWITCDYEHYPGSTWRQR